MKTPDSNVVAGITSWYIVHMFYSSNSRITCHRKLKLSDEKSECVYREAS
jgi:hypothetical protein